MQWIFQGIRRIQFCNNFYHAMQKCNWTTQFGSVYFFIAWTFVATCKKHLSPLCLFISFVCLLVCLVICECHLTISCVCCNNACICLMPALFTLFVVIAFGCQYVSLVICWPACLFATSPFATSVCHFIYVSVSKKPLTCLFASFFCRFIRILFVN